MCVRRYVYKYIVKCSNLNIEYLNKSVHFLNCELKKAKQNPLKGKYIHTNIHTHINCKIIKFPVLNRRV